MVRHIEPAQQETERWKQIRCTEKSLEDVRQWDAFQKTSRFWRKQLPVLVRQESMEQIEMLLTQHLVELRQRVA